MIVAESAVPDSAGEIDLLALWGVVWEYKFLVAIVTGICGAIALALALTTAPLFRAEAIIAQVSEDGMAGGGGLASQLGGLASLAGVKLGAAGAASEAKAVLESRRLVELFIERKNLLPVLYPTSKVPPTMWFGVQQFRGGVLTIREDVRKGVISVTVEWTDPKIAAQWANDFVGLANELIRTRAIDTSNRNIAYLNDQIDGTNVVEMRRVMYNLIENETKTLMLANARAEYAFTVVDPAVAPEMRISPRRTIMVLVGLFIGMLLGTALAFAYRAWRRRKVVVGT